MFRNFSRALGSIFLISYFSLFFMQKINLTTADLGRHITNGQVFVKEHLVVSTNHYSYAEPNFPVVTHHWLSGVIFYLINVWSGFKGLSLFYALLSGVTVFIFFKVAKKKSTTFLALFFTLLLIPLMASRKEIRPEGFSYFFLGFYLLLMEGLRAKEISLKKATLVLVVSQILWVNIHLFFIMGIFVIGVYLFNELIKQYFYKENSRSKEYLMLVISTTLASLVNPYFIKGLFEPLNIFKEYGYMIVENQSIFFMQKRAPSFLYFFMEILALVSVYLIINLVISKSFKKYFHFAILALAFLALSFKAIRGIPMFALFFLPLVSSVAADKLGTIKNKFLIPSIFILLLSLIPNSNFSFLKPGFGLGLHSKVNASAEFFQQNKLKGPIFNNYDIGGYLIYHLYQKEPVFVDNRPEAYSADFLQNVYVKSQEDEEKWHELDSIYNFNVIYFYRHDATPWAQPFLITRIRDPNWVPVFVDNYVLILVKNSKQNRAIIEAHQLPESYFVVT